MTEISLKTEEQVRAELSQRTKEDLELIADIHIQFKEGAPAEMIVMHHLRKSVARELLGLNRSARDNGLTPWL